LNDELTLLLVNVKCPGLEFHINGPHKPTDNLNHSPSYWREKKLSRQNIACCAMHNVVQDKIHFRAYLKA